MAVFPLFPLYLETLFFNANEYETIVVFNCLFRDNGFPVGANC